MYQPKPIKSVDFTLSKGVIMQGVIKSRPADECLDDAFLAYETLVDAGAVVIAMDAYVGFSNLLRIYKGNPVGAGSAASYIAQQAPV